MTATTWNPQTLTTVTLTEAQWSTIRTAVLCLACDCRTAGKSVDADYFLNAYNGLMDAYCKGHRVTVG
jgi:hypothetical protein